MDLGVSLRLRRSQCFAEFREFCQDFRAWFDFWCGRGRHFERFFNSNYCVVDPLVGFVGGELQTTTVGKAIILKWLYVRGLKAVGIGLPFRCKEVGDTRTAQAKSERKRRDTEP